MRTKDWNDWYCFAMVAQLASFTRAAERLEQPKSSVSLAISRLEKRAGVRLLERSTRRLRLTAEGEQLLAAIAPLFTRLDDIADHLHAGDDRLRGVLRIAAPYEFGTLQLADVICDVLAEHPELDIHVDVSARRVDPIADGYDIVFVVTADALPDSSQVARQVFSVERGLYASPGLIAALPPLDHPAGLAQWPQLASPNEQHWQFRDAQGQSHVLALAPRLRTQNAALRLRAATQGLGVAMVATTFCEPEVQRGELVRLLPAWPTEPLIIYALLPARRLMPARTRHFLDRLAAYLQAGG
ncbi:LysR family transcriptional regulator [Jeongeupia naejangsanensis]|uniref:LysR family transcriptional regulator n=1 Tax=Jeongeupia naejangsanensis TaxID=613195 RepID=A0ABS2BLK3_9NEIS|nr:LysR family transcriptional regulator [Jeongeupia naejangsanensis]MBM3116330.1 LysR family transcriptional regulator [Jeongeupia naejangsanensis]